MDVRGPTRAATRRLIQGMVGACAVAAVSAPAAGAATVSNANPTAVATYAPETADTSHHLVLGADPLDAAQLLFTDTLSPINPVLAGADIGNPETCNAPGAGSSTATCPTGPV